MSERRLNVLERCERCKEPACDATAPPLSYMGQTVCPACAFFVLVKERDIAQRQLEGTVGAVESLALAKELLARGAVMEDVMEHIDAALEQLGVQSS